MTLTPERLAEIKEDIESEYRFYAAPSWKREIQNARELLAEVERPNGVVNRWLGISAIWEARAEEAEAALRKHWMTHDYDCRMVVILPTTEERSCTCGYDAAMKASE